MYLVIKGKLSGIFSFRLLTYLHVIYFPMETLGRGGGPLTSDQPTDSLNDIFERILSGRTLFTNRNALRNEFIPTQIHYRDDQIKGVAQILSPVLTGHKPSSLLIYGKTGTGKTVVTKYVINRLTDKGKTTTNNLRTAYVNTRIASTEYRVLSELATNLGVTLPFTGLSLSEAFNRITNKIKDDTLKTIFVLDEIDFLVKSSGDNLLYEFTRANENLNNESFITLVGISNDLQFKESLDPRVLSSLNEEEIVFPPYSVDELKAILQERIEMAFVPGAVSEAAVNLCAGMAAAEHGDARRAVDLLRVAGELAERENASSIEDTHVREASKSIERDRVLEAIQSLPIHGKLALFAVSYFAEAENTGHVYAKYAEITKQLGFEPLTQRRVSGLLSELDLLGLVSAPVVSKGRMGRSKKIQLEVPRQTIIASFKDDETMKAFM
jgi:cell division control protein 6